MICLRATSRPTTALGLYMSDVDVVTTHCLVTDVLSWRTKFPHRMAENY